MEKFSNLLQEGEVYTHLHISSRST